jgi:hypothetical protein
MGEKVTEAGGRRQNGRWCTLRAVQSSPGRPEGRGVTGFDTGERDRAPLPRSFNRSRKPSSCAEMLLQSTFGGDGGRRFVSHSNLTPTR